MPTPATESAEGRSVEIGIRLGAGAIDLFILFVQWNAIVFIFSVASTLLAVLRRNLTLGAPFLAVQRALLLTGWVWSVAVIVLYFPFWWQHDGQTFGMRLLNLRVVTVDGGPLSWSRAILRWLAALLGSGLLAVGWLWIVVDGRRRPLHDRVTRTLVISTESDTL